MSDTFISLLYVFSFVAILVGAINVVGGYYLAGRRHALFLGIFNIIQGVTFLVLLLGGALE
jgi:hypothetical protein